MKNRYILLMFLGFMIVNITFGQPQLTFRYANPRTMRYSGADYFEFDIQVMASSASTYLWSGQAVFTFDNSTLSQTSLSWGMTRGPLLSGYNSRFGGTYVKYPTLILNINGTAPNKTAIIAWGGDPVVEGNGPNGSDFNLITTSYQTLVTVDVPITTTTGVAGISFIPASMNGQQFYISAPSTFTNYFNPNLYNSNDFLTTYVGRIYSNTYGWSQVGNTSNAQWVNWATAVNTSVWDTIGGAAAPIVSSITNGQAGALRIHTGAALNINAGAALTCSGATEINEARGLVISAGSSALGQFIDNGTIIYNGSATAQVQCYLVKDMWHYYTIPITTTLARQFAGKYMKYYQEPIDHYKYVVAPDSTLNTIMLGYELWANSSGPYATDNYIKPSGTLNTGTKSINLTNNGTTSGGWNLIGNPYPSAIDLTSGGVTWGNTFTTLYFWNAAGGDYITYLESGGGVHSKYVPPQQSFFIYSNITTTTFGLDNSTRVINPEPFLKDAIPERLILTASSSNNSYYDISVIRFTPEASTSFDPYYDAFKLYGNYNAPQLYSIGNADTILSVNALKWIDNAQVVPMGFSCGLDGHYSILASNMETFQPNVNIYIEDIKDNIWQDLKANPTYNFSYSTTDNANRFRIHFSRPNDGVGNNSFAGMQIYSFEDYVYVKNLVKGTTKGTIQIFDLIGRKVFQAMLKDMELNRFLPGVNEGYYMVNVITDDNSYTRKVYLR